MERKISFRLSDEQETLITAAAKKWNTSEGDVIRRAVDAYLNPNKSQQNLETILRRLNEIEVQEVTTRAVFLRCFDMLGHTLTKDQLIKTKHEARKDAEAHLGREVEYEKISG